ncbi:hypothetical protein IW262DRAFT_1333787 [Armillaria fumosa]|nr:hypothetical protein IW262DRAFT_1333787 [Armillaria fumosa]
MRKHCLGEIESMEHVMTSCQSPGQTQIWELTEEILPKKGIEWRAPTLGLILTLGMPVFKNEAGKRTTLQNDNGELGAAFHPNKIRNRWIKMVNDCL